MREAIKLSAPLYCEKGRAAALDYLSNAPGNLDPEAPRARFEAELAAYLGVPAAWVIATNSCTAALTIACRMLDTKGAGVEAPVLTWPATYAHSGPAALVDVAPTEHGEPTPEWPRSAGRVRIPVALWGIEAVLPPRDGGPIVVDAAHALGAHIEDLREGRVDAVCYSFGPLKEVPCSRGGALVSPFCGDAKWRAASDSGTHGRHGLFPWGGNYQMGEPECVLGVYQLAYAAEWREYRQKLLRWYGTYWSECGLGSTGCLLTEPGEASGHLCVALANSHTQRELWRARLLASDIQCGVHYELPLWAPAVQWPSAWDWSQRILSLPCHLGIGEQQLRLICSTLAG